MTRTCPHCGKPLPRDPAQVAAHRRHEKTPERKAYNRDYHRGRKHGLARKPPEAPRTTPDYRRDAYLTGHAAGTALAEEQDR